MNRFYAGEAPAADKLVPLSREDTLHAVRVLRLKPGDRAELFWQDQRYLAEAVSLDSESALFRVLSPLPSTEARLRITLFQGISKADRMELTIQKAVELGAEAVVPVAMTRCVARLEPGDAGRKIERWQKIAREACKQSGRCVEPAVSTPVTIPALCRALAGYDAALVPWEEAEGYGPAAFHRDHPEVRRLALVIGPEGGITPEEIGALQAAGCRPVTLGPRILRTETAGPAAIAALMALYGEMDG
ncbi:MAG: 16S rRNA (uracil(1498)-N(3))-methyltransferase [Clostridia bacterium]|nr:16S rRNA (uracil(1498)-N(3))-methyltransferase [Clostridia bacterium]